MSSKRYSITLEPRYQDALDHLRDEHDRSAASMIRVLIGVASGILPVGNLSSIVRQRIVNEASTMRQGESPRRHADAMLTHGTDAATRARVSSEIKKEEEEKEKKIRRASGAPVAAIAAEVLEHLNQVAGTHFQARSKSTQAAIKARMKEGARCYHFRKVIDGRWRAWATWDGRDNAMKPSTLFRASNFWDYYGAADQNKRSRTAAKQQSFSRTERNALRMTLSDEQIDALERGEDF